MHSKHEKKRKRELDSDTTIENQAANDEHRRRHRSRSRSPKKSKRHKHENASPQKSSDKSEESLSIEETNKLRAKLGLSPLELDDKINTEPVEKDDGSGEKVFTEYGIEITHKPSRNWSDEKRQKELKEKLENRRKQRDIYPKILKAKSGLGDDDETSDAAKWIEKSRRMEEEMRKAQEKARQLDEMDEAFGVGAMLKAEQKKQQRSEKKEITSTSGLIVGHSVQDFQEGRETVLVLKDKSILDEGDDGEEVLINPNMLENEQHKLNVERRKKKASHYTQYDDEEIDEFGQVKKKEILSKYDEGLDGEEKKREIFRLDESGQYDLDKEVQEAEAKRRLMMMNKKFESLGDTKYVLANEFYTAEEVIQFRRPKKKGGKSTRKKAAAALKAMDIEQQLGAVEETEAEKKAREKKLAARRAGRGDGGTKTDGKGEFSDTLREASAMNGRGGGRSVEDREEGELVEEVKKEKVKQEKDAAAMPPPSQTKWKKPTASVDVKMLHSLAERIKKGEDEEEDEEEEFLPHMSNVAPVKIDDDAEDELQAILAKARRLKHEEQAMKKKQTAQLSAINEEEAESSEDDETAFKGGGSTAPSIVFDATSEKYKSIGGGGYGVSVKKKEMKMENDVEAKYEPMQDFMDIDQGSANGEKRKRKLSASSSGSSANFERMVGDRSESSESDTEHPSSSYSNILGEEKDVTKGVAAMLKLAGQKGYLESGGKRRAGEGSLKHLESKRYSKVDQGRFDIEDKTMRKLERMGTTGTGPTRPFPEKSDYTPKIEINYSDKSGRVLEPKEAFRVLSWKFHGKGPGKKQAEKHIMKVVKREKLKKMNSQDTPLGTLNKQLKRQEQLSSAYLVLSGRGDAAPLQKE